MDRWIVRQKRQTEDGRRAVLILVYLLLLSNNEYTALDASFRAFAKHVNNSSIQWLHFGVPSTIAIIIIINSVYFFYQSVIGSQVILVRQRCNIFQVASYQVILIDISMSSHREDNKNTHFYRGKINI